MPMSVAHDAGEEGILDPKIRRFVEYWRGKRGAGEFPARADLDPIDFRYVLGDVALINASRAPVGSRWPWEFHYRLIGAALVERDGYDLTNKPLDALPEPEYRERVRASFIEVCETRTPIHRIRELFLDRRPRRYEAVVMPLASNGHDIDMLVSVQREMRGGMGPSP
jgi:hypothetical protein